MKPEQLKQEFKLAISELRLPKNKRHGSLLTASATRKIYDLPSQQHFDIKHSIFTLLKMAYLNEELWKAHGKNDWHNVQYVLAAKSISLLIQELETLRARVDLTLISTYPLTIKGTKK